MEPVGPSPERGLPSRLPEPMGGNTGFSFESEEHLQSLKEIKVKLPVSQHIKLHSLKITRNRSISEVVARALEDYFAKIDHDKTA